jgi:hypothetical protein
VVIEDSASQFHLLKEEMATAKENLRSPQLSCDKAERSQGLSHTERSRASSHQDNQNLGIKPSREVSENVSPTDQLDLCLRWLRKSLASRKSKDASEGGSEDEVSKRAHVERDSGFISGRILELAQVFAPPQFEFPTELLTPCSTTALALPTEISPPSLTFLWVFDTKPVIHEDPTVQTQIRLRKRDPSSQVHVSTDWFEVFS